MGRAVFIAMLVVAVFVAVSRRHCRLFGPKRFLFFFIIGRCLYIAMFFSPRRCGLYRHAVFIIWQRSVIVRRRFYNGLLPEIADQDEMGHISGNGWAIGTAGGVICLLLILPLVVVIGGTLIVRFSLVITAVFFAVSAIPIFVVAERAKPKPIPAGDNSWTIAIKRLKHDSHGGRLQRVPQVHAGVHHLQRWRYYGARILQRSSARCCLAWSRSS